MILRLLTSGRESVSIAADYSTKRTQSHKSGNLKTLLPPQSASMWYQKNVLVLKLNGLPLSIFILYQNA